MMAAQPVHNHMALTGVRLLVQLLGMFYGCGGGALLYLFSFDRHAARAFVIGNLIAYLFAPDKEARDRYIEFQTKRLPPQP
jgi:hypothetical protein